MKNKFLICILSFFLLAVLNIQTVYADSIGGSLSKGEEDKVLEAGDIVTVEYHIETAVNREEQLDLQELFLTLYYDSDVFEIVEGNSSCNFSYSLGKVVGCGSERNGLSKKNMDNYNIEFNDENSAIFYGYGDKTVLKVKFKVKENVITQTAKIYNNERDRINYFDHYYDDYDYGEEDDYYDGKSEEITGYSELVYSIVGKNTDASLKSLSVENYRLIPEFKTNVKNYVVNVNSDVDNVNILATCNGKNCQITGNGKKTLKVGDNNFDIVVKSESGTQETYKLIIVRAEDNRSKDSNLVLARIFDSNTKEEIKFDFDGKDIEYNIDVLNDVSNIYFDLECSNALCKIDKKNNYDLAEGNNKIEITVTAENGDKKTYIFNINRKNETKKFLKSLSIYGYQMTPQFEENTYEYHVDYDGRFDELDIKYETKEKNTKVTIEGNKDLKNIDNNKIKVKLKASKEENNTTYTILLNRIKNNENTNIIVYLLIIIVIAIIVVMVILYFVLRKKKKSKIANNAENNNIQS